MEHQNNRADNQWGRDQALPKLPKIMLMMMTGGPRKGIIEHGATAVGGGGGSASLFGGGTRILVVELELCSVRNEWRRRAPGNRNIKLSY